jgi:death on curing protein
VSDPQVRYLTLDDWNHLAAAVLGVEMTTVAFTADLNLADSALHAPRASFSGTELYPDLVDKAAVLGWHLVKNHPLPDGNKRCALIAMVVFLRLNGMEWVTPPAEGAVGTMLAVAAGELDVGGLAAWRRGHTA